MSDVAISVRGLTVQRADGRTVVDKVNFDVKRGEVLGVVGESGSGKTTLGLGLLAHVRSSGVVAGDVRIGGKPILQSREIEQLRGSLISYVPQDPSVTLNPSMTIGALIIDVLRAHGRLADGEARARELLRMMQLPDSADFLGRYPHQLSGGQQQRVAIALALACDPTVTVMDEPTTALDVVTQRRLLQSIAGLRDRYGIAIVYISHDLAVVSAVADRILVLHSGTVVEEGPTQSVLSHPRHAYTRQLVAAAPDYRNVQTAGGAAAKARCPRPSLTVRGLNIRYGSGERTVVAARDVSLDVFPNQCLALVGESGSGKTSIARCIAGLMAPASGVLEFQGEPLRRFASHRSLEQRRRIQMIFQNPRDSLNPRWRIVDTVARPAERFLGSFNAEAKSAALRLLEQVRLPLALAGRYPSELSGGELQRVAIARALICNPELIICDEITSALDVSVQATVLDLIDEIRKERQLAMLFVTHDLGVVARVADDVLVLKSGEVQECARAEQVLLRPEADYTRLLIASAATMETGEAREQVTAS